MRWDEMRWDQMRSDQIRSDQIRSNEISDLILYDLRWDKMRWDEMRWDDSGSIVCWTSSSGVGFGTPHMTTSTWAIYVDFLYFRHNNIQIINFNFKILASHFFLFVECLIVHGRGDWIRAIFSEESPIHSDSWLEFLFCIVANIVVKKVPNLWKIMVTAHPCTLPSRD